MRKKIKLKQANGNYILPDVNSKSLIDLYRKFLGELNLIFNHYEKENLNNRDQIKSSSDYQDFLAVYAIVSNFELQSHMLEQKTKSEILEMLNHWKKIYANEKLILLLDEILALVK